VQTIAIGQNLDICEFFGGSLLQSLEKRSWDSQLHSISKGDDDPIALGIVPGGLGTRLGRVSPGTGGNGPDYHLILLLLVHLIYHDAFSTL